jgi:glycosyltransferase involved in cell wall biosynthesis
MVLAMPELIKKYEDISLVFLATDNGDPGYAQYVQEMVEKMGLENHVFSNVKLPYARMPQAYNAADVIMSIPTTDGQSITNLEAMACLKPVVATNCVTNTGLIPQEWLVDPSNVQQVIDTIIGILDGTTCNNGILKENRWFVTEHFDLNDTMNRIVRLYGRLI